jgi:hypothetical protein
MNDQQRAAMQMALDALEFYQRRCNEQGFYSVNRQQLPVEAIAALRESLTQPQGEPVGWGLMHKNGLEINSGYGVRKTLEEAEEMQRRHLGDVKIVPLYTAPQSVEAAVLAEREACAKVCDKISLRFFKDRCDPQQFVSDQCAAAIRGLK